MSSSIRSMMRSTLFSAAVLLVFGTVDAGYCSGNCDYRYRGDRCSRSSQCHGIFDAPNVGCACSSQRYDPIYGDPHGARTSVGAGFLVAIFLGFVLAGVLPPVMSYYCIIRPKQRQGLFMDPTACVIAWALWVFGCPCLFCVPFMSDTFWRTTNQRQETVIFVQHPQVVHQPVVQAQAVQAMAVPIQAQPLQAQQQVATTITVKGH